MHKEANTPDSSHYIGNELELFQLAVNWKRYLASRIRPFLAGDVLEVGAGLGANVPYFFSQEISTWTSLEPDPQLCELYNSNQTAGKIPSNCRLIQGTLATLKDSEHFDSIIYIDVLEHIENDRHEFESAYNRLKPNGHLVVLCPAHNFLFSPFDKAIGHFRRYNKKMYRQLSTQHPLKLEYLDSAGMLASIANKLLLKQDYPNERQIRIWDTLLVRISKMTDPLIFRLIGKSVLGVWKKT